MPPSTPSFLRSRSLSSSSLIRPVHPSPSYEHINISSIDTPTHSLRSEVLIGFHPIDPHYLITLSRSAQAQDTIAYRPDSQGECEIGLWQFHPKRKVRLQTRLKVEEQPDYLPIAVCSTSLSTTQNTYYQIIYRASSEDGEGCIEIRSLPLEKLTTKMPWNLWESVTEEDGLLGGICWSLLGSGYLTVATASRVYFFSSTTMEKRDVKEECWTCGRNCLIFEVDVYLQKTVVGQPMRFATRLLNSIDGKMSVLVFASQKTELQSFKLEIDMNNLSVKVCAKTDAVQWKSGARGALLAWSMGRKLMTGHCCEDECGELLDEGRISVFKTWCARGDKRSLKQLVWDYGCVVIDCWDT